MHQHFDVAIGQLCEAVASRSLALGMNCKTIVGGAQGVAVGRKVIVGSPYVAEFGMWADVAGVRQGAIRCYGAATTSGRQVACLFYCQRVPGQGDI